MPVYEYACEACNRINEVEHRMSEPGPKECPSCGASGIRKIISRTAFTLKGGGWYNEGYSSKKPSGSDKVGGSDAAPASSEASAACAKPACQSTGSCQG